MSATYQRGVTEAWFDPRNRWGGAAIHAISDKTPHGPKDGTALCGADVQVLGGPFNADNVQSCKRCARAARREEVTPVDGLTITPLAERNAHIELDERDRGIIAARMAALDAYAGPRVGDWVIFADGVERRISHAWTWPADETEDGLTDGYQTSDGGSWYLSDAGCSFSGSLHPLVKPDTLTDTGDRRDGSAWIFHHDGHWAHNGVEFLVPFRVFTCSEVAP